MAHREAVMAWLYLQQAVHAVEEALNATMEQEVGCSLLEHGALYRLKIAADHRMTMADMADGLMVSPSGVTRLVERLVKRGWVERYRPPENRRTVYAVLTDEGLRVVAEHGQFAYREAVTEHFASTVDDADLERLGMIGRRLLESHGRWDAKRFAPPA